MAAMKRAGEIKVRANRSSIIYRAVLVLFSLALCGAALTGCREDQLDQRLLFIFASCVEQTITDVCLVQTPKELRGQRFRVTSSAKSMIGGQEIVLVFPDLGKEYLALIYDYGGGTWELRYIEERTTTPDPF